MTEHLYFPTLLRMIDERSAAFRAAVAAAPSLDADVPSCPGWTMYDLANHLSEGDRFWAYIVLNTEPGAERPSKDGLAAPREREALITWLADSTEQLLTALREAGPDRGCWAWWEPLASPHTVAAVARRRVPESLIHTYDAQLASGTPQELLPRTEAVDAIEEFLATVCTVTVPWPGEPATMDYHAADAGSWRQTLDAAGSRFTRLTAAEAAESKPTAAVYGTASEIALIMYMRIPAGSLRMEGDADLLHQLQEWD
ncbi:maleylpyruvate isomerase N-terminal domain-containing protein [Streptomyces glycanivorans]|uniref:Maleylpyruvate isomerase family mycothiol-dependent enzyme n=1 Tax=Streptomyces glycanivorans TaxID=3033808 RepID=A0ABY9J897_9ACTN|nr:maleylpyruvate isomerase family mycothiol-dependent enzyme [Streptomyces sp. Alt3]WLQ62191.1 maleylpyruvate isomerase family mycothiol-dependent enzyme [Streptomyces sp. Alt3]